jgi:hypothetical protein
MLTEFSRTLDVAAHGAVALHLLRKLAEYTIVLQPKSEIDVFSIVVP